MIKIDREKLFQISCSSLLLIPILSSELSSKALLAVFFVPILLTLGTFRLNQVNISFLHLLLLPILILSLLYYFNLDKNYMRTAEATNIKYLFSTLILSFLLKDKHNIIKYFSICFCVLASIISIAGLIKYFLMYNGYLFYALIQHCGELYPEGTSICGDYNLFGGILLIGIIFSQQVYASNKFKWLGISTFVFSSYAGILLGSRRFIILYIAIVVIIILAHFVRSSIDHKKLKIPSIQSAIGALTFILVAVALTSAENSRAVTSFTIIGEPKIIESDNETNEAGDQIASDNKRFKLARRGTSATKMLSNISEQSPRILRYELAFDLLEIWPTQGSFLYQKLFACKFNGCQGVDYPHSAILSGWFAFGIVGLLLTLASLLSIALLAIIASAKGYATTIGLATAVTMLNSLVSYDSLIANRPLFVVAVLALIVASSPSKASWKSFVLGVTDNNRRTDEMNHHA